MMASCICLHLHYVKRDARGIVACCQILFRDNWMNSKDAPLKEHKVSSSQHVKSTLYIASCSLNIEKQQEVGLCKEHRNICINSDILTYSEEEIYTYLHLNTPILSMISSNSKDSLSGKVKLKK